MPKLTAQERQKIVREVSTRYLKEGLISSPEDGAPVDDGTNEIKMWSEIADRVREAEAGS